MNMYNPSGNMYGQPVSGNHSDRMEIAAMTLGIISIVSCTCLYLAIPCGALAIILASLSRGGQMRYGAKAQVGLILGILGIVLAATLMTVPYEVFWESMSAALRNGGFLVAGIFGGLVLEKMNQV